MSNHIEDTPSSRRKLLKGAAGAAGGLAVGSLFSPELAAAIPRRRLAPTKVVVMSKELTSGAGTAGTPSISDFEDTHPNIKIEYLDVDAAKFQAMMAAGQPPDIWRTQAPLVPQWAKRGQLLNLDIADSYNWIDRHVMVQLASIGKSLYPKDFSHINLTKNPAAMEAFHYSFRYSQHKLDLGPENPNPDGWSGPGFVAANPSVAMTQYGYWFLGMISDSGGPIVKNAQLVPAPKWKHGKHRDPTITATGWVISAQSKNPDAAWTVFEWYMGGKPARDRAGIGWGVPAQRSLIDRLPETNRVQRNAKKTLLHELKSSKVVLQYNPNLVGLADNTAVATAYQKYLADAAKGKMSFKDFMKKVEADTNRAIKVGKQG